MGTLYERAGVSGPEAVNIIAINAMLTDVEEHAEQGTSGEIYSGHPRAGQEWYTHDKAELDKREACGDAVRALELLIEICED